MAIFKFRRAATSSAGENLTVSAAITYWTFVVRLQSRTRLKSNGLLGTESVTKSNGSTHSDRSLRSHQTPTVANEDEPWAALVAAYPDLFHRLPNDIQRIKLNPIHSKNSILRTSTVSDAKRSPIHLEKRSSQPAADNSGDRISHRSQTVFFHGCARHVAPDCTTDCFNNEADDVHRFGFLFCSRFASIGWSANGTQRKKRRQLPESVWLFPRIHISGLTSLEWLARNALPMRWPTCRFETYLSRQKQTIRPKSYRLRSEVRRRN